jgi:glycosyltransferase involved in cell wall biosynthesis
LRAQDHPNFDVAVRDDGSSDATLAILDEHARRGELTVRRAPHVGVIASFFDLLQADCANVDHAAFCDQDDVWHPDKLRRACEALDQHPSNVPVLYCARTRIVDQDLRLLGLSRLPRRAPCFENALVENVATGCTMALNRAAIDLIAVHLPQSLVVHDWWCYLLVAAFGHVVFDAEPRVDYRQHAGNVVGSSTTVIQRWLRRLRPLARNLRNHPLLRQARELQRLYADVLPPDRRTVLDRFLVHRQSWPGAIRYASRPDVFRQAPLDDFILRTMLWLRLV